ncbi:hypothetical protein C7458_1072 [Williamsia muralis]|nr:hypothetical protein C7458_1072 [Williamsia marianensis]
MKNPWLRSVSMALVVGLMWLLLPAHLAHAGPEPTLSDVDPQATTEMETEPPVELPALPDVDSATLPSPSVTLTGIPVSSASEAEDSASVAPPASVPPVQPDSEDESNNPRNRPVPTTATPIVELATSESTTRAPISAPPSPSPESPVSPRALASNLATGAATVTVPASNSDATVYENRTGAEIMVDVNVDGVRTNHVYPAGDTVSIPGCPATAQSCSVGVFDLRDTNTPLMYRSLDNLPPVQVGNYVTDAMATGPGVGTGFSGDQHALIYSNRTGRQMEVSFDDASGELQTFVVRDGESVALPECNINTGARCHYIVGSGNADSDPSNDVVESVTAVDQSGTSYVNMSEKNSPFLVTSAGVLYSNNSSDVVQVSFEDPASGNQTLVQLLPGEAVALPQCTLSPGNRCMYITGEPPYLNNPVTLSIGVTDALKGNPTNTTTISSIPGTTTKTSSTTTTVRPSKTTTKKPSTPKPTTSKPATPPKKSPKQLIESLTQAQKEFNSAVVQYISSLPDIVKLAVESAQRDLNKRMTDLMNIAKTAGSSISAEARRNIEHLDRQLKDVAKIIKVARGAGPVGVVLGFIWDVWDAPKAG